MRWLDEHYPRPRFRVRRLTAWRRRQGAAVHPKPLRRLRRHMGFAAIDPQPRLRQPAAGQAISPYLRRGVTSGRVNQAWRAASTSIRGAAGFVSLVAVIAGCSRDGWSGAVSITLEVACGVEALEQALRRGQPEIFKTDQGCSGPVRPSPRGDSKEGCGSGWMALAGSSIRCVWNGGGAV